MMASVSPRMKRHAIAIVFCIACKTPQDEVASRLDREARRDEGCHAARQLGFVRCSVAQEIEFMPRSVGCSRDDLNGYILSLVNTSGNTVTATACCGSTSVLSAMETGCYIKIR